MKDADIKNLSYENAKEELDKTVASLEGDALSLDDSLKLYKTANALIKHMENLLSNAEKIFKGAQNEGNAESNKNA